ncbi:MAG: hypothetical protein HY674_12650 [Chloroflexi bacterium]|nr:hypothetical protein [Chloroflexota bacterium]
MVLLPGGSFRMATTPEQAERLAREYHCQVSWLGGEVKPGQTTEAVNKAYFVEATPEEWHRRIREEFSGEGARP